MGRGWKVLSIPPPPVSFILRLRLHRWHTTLGVPDHALSRGPGLFASRSFIACGGLWRVGTNSRETKYHLICNINRGRRCMLRVVLSCSLVFPRVVEGVGGCFPSGFGTPPPLAQKAMMCIMRSLYPCPPSLLYYPWHDNRRTVGNNKQHVSGGRTRVDGRAIAVDNAVLSRPSFPHTPVFRPSRRTSSSSHRKVLVCSESGHVFPPPACNLI